MDLSSWAGAPRPERTPIEGLYTKLEPLDPTRHGDDLFASAQAERERFRYLFEEPPPGRAEFDTWLARVAQSPDPMFFAVIDKATGRAEGRQTLMRLDPAMGVIEIGNILWGPAIARSRVTTEALYLFAKTVFDLGYRRFEWKCNNANEPSKAAALRFGFKPEGVFRQHMVVKGKNRDTAWYSILDSEWPALAKAYEAWLDPSNFDAAGRQKAKLGAA